MSDTSRRILGLVFGLIVGLTYGLISRLANVLLLPGVPLYYPGPGLAIDILLSGLNGGLIGLIAAWPEDALPGILLSSLVGALTTTLYSLQGRSGGLEYYSGLFVLLVMTFLPRAFIFLPIAGLTRWVLSIWANEFQGISFSVRRLALSLATLVLLGGIAGILSLYPQFARQSLVQMNQLVLAGLEAANTGDLPQPLQAVSGFMQAAQGGYSLELSDNPDRLPIQRPIGPYGEQEYAVIVRFENGYRFGCVFTPSYKNPACGNY